MTNEERNSLQEIYHSFLDEAEALEKEISENELLISEAENYIRNLSQPDMDDFQVFSPRSISMAHKADMEQKKDTIEKLKNSNIYLHGRLAKINSYILGLESVLRENGNGFFAESTYSENSVAEKTYTNNSASEKSPDFPTGNLDYLYHKIEMIRSDLDKDIEKAKAELDVFCRQFSNTIQEMKEDSMR